MKKLFLAIILFIAYAVFPRSTVIELPVPTQQTLLERQEMTEKEYENSFVEPQEEERSEFELVDTGFEGGGINKSYMDYRAITSTASSQYQLIHDSGEVTISEEGFLMRNGHYGVAMGSYFGEIGTEYLLHIIQDNPTNEGGEEVIVLVPVFKVEAKADIHTCDKNITHTVDGSVVEFVIDTSAEFMQENTWGNGLVFSGNFNNYELFSGEIVAISEVINY